MITHVAVKQDGKVYSAAAARHSDVISIVFLQTGKLVTQEQQGFLDHNGNFLTREEAYQEAIKCNQLKYRSSRASLFSEMLW